MPIPTAPQPPVPPLRQVFDQFAQIGEQIQRGMYGDEYVDNQQKLADQAVADALAARARMRRAQQRIERNAQLRLAQQWTIAIGLVVAVAFTVAILARIAWLVWGPVSSGDVPDEHDDLVWLVGYLAHYTPGDRLIPPRMAPLVDTCRDNFDVRRYTLATPIDPKLRRHGDTP